MEGMLLDTLLITYRVHESERSWACLIFTICSSDYQRNRWWTFITAVRSATHTVTGFSKAISKRCCQGNRHKNKQKSSTNDVIHGCFPYSSHDGNYSIVLKMFKNFQNPLPLNQLSGKMKEISMPHLSRHLHSRKETNNTNPSCMLTYLS